MHQAGEGEDRGIGRDLLLPQGTFDLFPVPRHHLIIVCALCKEEEGHGGGGRAQGKWAVYTNTLNSMRGNDNIF